MLPLTALPRWLAAPWQPAVAAAAPLVLDVLGRLLGWYDTGVTLVLGAAVVILVLGFLARTALRWLSILDRERTDLRHTLVSVAGGLPGTLTLTQDTAPRDDLDGEAMRAMRPATRQYALDERYVCDTRFPLLADGRVLGLGRHVVDVTDELRARAETETARAQAQSFLDAAPDATLMVDPTGTIRYANPQVAVLLGYFVDELVGSPVEMLVPEAARERHADHRASYDARPARRTMGKRADLTARHRDGHQIGVDISISPILAEDGHWTLVSLRDAMTRRATEQALRDAQERYRHLAEHDPLTGLMNRRRFESELEGHLAACRRTGARGALLSVDLDNFKTVNDTRGHHVGDQLVTAVGHALRTTMRDGDPVARQGGDEFLVLIREGGDAEAAAIAMRLLEAVSDAARMLSDGVSESRIPVTGSVGAVVLRHVPVADLTVEATMIAADVALYRAKDAGRGRAVFHHDATDGGMIGPVSGDMWV